MGIASTLGVAAGARVVNKYAPHHLRGNGEEVGLALPVHGVLIYEPYVCFVYQSGGLEGMFRSLLTHVVVSKSALVEQW